MAQVQQASCSMPLGGWVGVGLSGWRELGDVDWETRGGVRSDGCGLLLLLLRVVNLDGAGTGGRCCGWEILVLFLFYAGWTRRRKCFCASRMLHLLEMVMVGGSLWENQVYR